MQGILSGKWLKWSGAKEEQDMAQAGGTQPEKLDAAIEKSAYEVIGESNYS